MKNLFALALLLFFLGGCNSSKKTTGNSTQNEFNVIKQKLELSSLQKQGVDYFAEGESPTNWELFFNIDDSVRFKTNDGLALTFAYNQLKKTGAADLTSYTASLKAGAITINLYEKLCEGTQKKQANVSFRTTVYSGCGSYLADENLNKKWLLQAISNTKIKREAYEKVPVFEFDLNNKKITGTDGCNNFNGNIDAQGKRIIFSTINLTKKNCKKNNIAAIINSLLSNQTVGYYFKNEQLVLYLPDDSLLTFSLQ